MGNHDQTSQSVEDITNLVQETSATQVPNSSLVEVRSAGDRGKGVFAVQDIVRGTRIISEAPLLVVQPASASGVDEKYVKAFCTAVRALPVEGLETLDELCWDEILPDSDQEKAQTTIHKWHEQHGDGKGHKLNTRKLRRADRRAFTRFSIFVDNRMGMGRDSMYGQGLFPLRSRINHSCGPNAFTSYNPTIERLTVHASRDIRAGDEVLTEYTNVTFRKRVDRQAVMKHWGFVCHCRACTNPGVRVLRDHMAGLEMSFRQQALEALEVNEKIADLLMHPTIDLQSESLCKIYRRCSRLCLELEDFQKAKEFARKELEVEEAVIGTETEHLSEDLVGAKYWLEHLEETY